MHSPCKRPPSTHTFLLGVLTTVTVPFVAFRILYAMGTFTIDDRVTNAATSITTVLLMGSTFALAWRRSVLRNRAERAILIDRIDVLEKRVEEAENAAWWGSPHQEDEPERTVELGTNVTVLRHRESRQRGAS